jgi:hypothetical protein
MELVADPKGERIYVLAVVINLRQVFLIPIAEQTDRADIGAIKFEVPDSRVEVL